MSFCIDIMDVVRLEISEKLPSYSRKNISSLFISADASDHEPQYRLQILPLKNHGLKPSTFYKIDAAYKIAENCLAVKCNYKCSQWEYRLSCLDSFNFKFEVAGDFFSSWCWPYRSLLPLVRLFMQKCGYYYFHSAGFFNQTDSSAVMLMAPSGTGKTLSTLHYLCNGGKMFHDDTVLWHNGYLYPTINTLNFWAYRYRKTPEVLPATLPAFAWRDRIRGLLFRFIRLISFGMVGLSLSLTVKKYWPECEAPVAPLKKIIVLSKSSELREIFSGIDPDHLKNRILGDLEFQNIALLRIQEMEELTGIQILNVKEFFESYQTVLNRVFKKCKLYYLEVPAKYSKTVFEKINQLIQK